MAPAKRKQSDGGATAPPKAKRLAAKEPPQPRKPAEEVVLPEREPLVALLDEAHELDCVGQGSRDMLQMSMRTTFSRPKQERHDFQSKVVSLFDKVFSDTESKLRHMLALAEEKVKVIVADRETASTLSEELKEHILAKTKEAETAQTALANAVVSTDLAQKELDAELAQEEELASKHAAKQAEKERFDAISEQWEDLTKVPEPGAKAAKARSKAVDFFMEAFAELPEVEQSLIDGVPHALKTKTRGDFTATVLAHSERALKVHLNALGEEMAACAKEAEATEAVVAAAKAKLEVAEKERDACQNMVKLAAAEAAELQKQKKEADGCVEGANKSVGIFASEVERLEQRLEKFTNLLSKYGELRDGPATADGLVATDGQS
mmetsp:Transcript_18309/g.42759  ORF Transcript_18309/g.42759 Transcript_18309/m.42759 type:complete len:379 (-) Transcript_18309:61-1197(-)